MKITKTQTDDVVLLELGQRLAQQRLGLELTQAELAHQAGVSKRTVERIEAGGSTQATNLIRVFRVLQLLPMLDQLIPDALPKPMELLKLKGKTRKRATSSRVKDKPDTQPWTWKQ